jgi:16S rRNA (uracil1498-N3)-methyltransferase
MRVGELTRVDAIVQRINTSDATEGWYCSTAKDAKPIADMLAGLAPGTSVVALIGPEGGWTDDELARFAAAGLTPARLTDTVLRVETAAVTVAAVIGSLATRPDA